ncbi:MAG TPA: hypothetical protein VGL94_05485 [Ktedonobacteraceae bacterium]|jgi:hypothetical protein
MLFDEQLIVMEHELFAMHKEFTLQGTPFREQVPFTLQEIGLIEHLEAIVHDKMLEAHVAFIVQEEIFVEHPGTDKFVIGAN